MHCCPLLLNRFNKEFLGLHWKPRLQNHIKKIIHRTSVPGGYLHTHLGLQSAVIVVR